MAGKGEAEKELKYYFLTFNTVNMMTPNQIFLSDYHPLKKKCRGYTDEYYKPAFPADTWVLGNLFADVHFCYCLN